jgi:type I restriction enzyme S subunit
MTVYKFADIAFNSTEKKKPEPSDKDVYIGLEHLDPGILEVTRYGAAVAPKGDKLVMRKGDVLFGRRRAYQKKVAIAPFDGIFSAHGMVLRPRTEVVDPGFFPFFISSDCFLDEAIRVSVGSLSPTANWKDLKELSFDLPSLDEQREIAGIMRTAERAKAGYRALIKASDDLVKSRFIEMFGDPTSLTPRFPLKPIGELATDIRYGTSKKAGDEGEYAYLRMNNMTDEGCLDFTDTKRITLSGVELENCLVKKGDLLFNRTNSREKVGKTAVFSEDTPMVIAGYIIRVRLNSEMRTRYLSAYMNLDSTKRLLRTIAKGAVHQANINSKELASIEVPVPPMRLQDSFLSFVDQVDKSKFDYEMYRRWDAFTLLWSTRA